jgi:hypothetical protein
MKPEQAVARFLQYGSLADATAAALSVRLAQELPWPLNEVAQQSAVEEVEHARLQRELLPQWGVSGVEDGPYPAFWRAMTTTSDLPFASTCLAVVEHVSVLQFRAVANKTQPSYTSEVLLHIAAEERRHVELGIKRLRALGITRTEVLRVAHIVNAMLVADPTIGQIARALGLPEIPGVGTGRFILRRL